jgi:hypothetical protein
MDEDGHLENIPLWMTDPEIPAPCFCGRPMIHGAPAVLISTEDGLKRVLHYECFQATMMDDLDDDE